MYAYAFILCKGVCTTAFLWLVASLGSFIIGSFLALVSEINKKTMSITACIRLYTFIAKGIPLYVHILIAYFVLPIIFKIDISGFTASLMALIFCSSGYVVEIVQSALKNISIGQTEAAYALGYSRIQTMKRIIFPQALKIMIRPLMGESEQVLKSTALCAVIGVTELTRTGMNIISRELNPLAVYTLIALVYLSFSLCMYTLFAFFEKRFRW